MDGDAAVEGAAGADGLERVVDEDVDRPVRVEMQAAGVGGEGVQVEADVDAEEATADAGAWSPAAGGRGRWCRVREGDGRPAGEAAGSVRVSMTCSGGADGVRERQVLVVVMAGGEGVGSVVEKERGGASDDGAVVGAEAAPAGWATGRPLMKPSRRWARWWV